MRKTSLFKRSMAGLLCFVLVLSLIPAMSWVAKAAEGDDSEKPVATSGPEGNFITLPITVRDFAADGMLFEFNEMNESNFETNDYNGNVTWTGTTTFLITDRLYYYTDNPYTAIYNPSYWATGSGGVWSADGDYTKIRIYPKGADLFKSSDSSQVAGVNWYCFIVDQDGSILKVLDVKTDKSNINTIMNSMESAAYSVWAWRDPKNVAAYSLLAKVTEENKSQYRFCFNTGSSDAEVTVYLGTYCMQDVAYWNLPAYPTGIYVYDNNTILTHLAVDGDVDNLKAYNGSWSCIVVDTYDNTIVDAIGLNEDKPSRIEACMDDNYASDYRYVFVWSADVNKAFYDLIAPITSSNKSVYRIALESCTVGDTLFVERSIDAHTANTKGFGLLYTLGSDYLHWLSDTNDSVNLPNTEYWEYSTSGTASYYYNTKPYEVDLWEENKKAEPYASQYLYGAGVRTNLVTKELDDEGKPVYTETTVDFLAKYMAKIMLVEEKELNTDIYNTHHVMGVKMFTGNAQEGYQYVDPKGPNAATATKDLAQVLRDKIYAANNNSLVSDAALGSY
ncbi:MAG: hypothetical protein IJN46_03565, partial [Lachnospiraceae bacterium]|nr:hypothetical protein [Lachnospiraceae bacterium]